MFSTAHNSPQLCLEVLVQEGVDKRVAHVVDEVHIEEDDLHAKQLQRHQPGGQKGDDEHQGHDEQGEGRFDVGHAHALNARFGDRALPGGNVVVGLSGLVCRVVSGVVSVEKRERDKVGQ